MSSLDGKKLYTGTRKFIRELQRSSDKRKKNWLIFSSAVSMVFVFALWIFYLNLTLPKTSEPVSENPVALAPGKSGDSVFQILGRGLGIILGNLKNGFEDIALQAVSSVKELKSDVGKTNQVSQGTASLKFIYQDLDPIPPTKLPESGKRKK